MNSIIESLNLWGERFVQFAWPMLWQSSLLILVLFILDLTLRRRVRPAVRHALWLVLLVKLLLPPTLALPTSIAWWIRPSPSPQPPARQFVVTYSNTERPQPSLNLYEAFTGGKLESPNAKPSSRGWLLLLSGFVSFGLFTWMLRRWWQVARLVRCAAPATEALADLVNDARQTLNLRRSVSLRFTDNSMSPAVCGLFRPAVILSQSLAEHLPPNQLRAVLLHELAHLKRGDVWVNCAQALLQVAYWWHPLLWLANARIRRVREEAVDDAVMLALRDEAETYAPTLLEVAKQALNRPLTSLGLVGIMESRSALRQRIERLTSFSPPRKAGLTELSALGVIVFSALAVPMEKAPATGAKPAFRAFPQANSVSGNPTMAETNIAAILRSVRRQDKQKIVKKLHQIRLDHVFYDDVSLEGVIRSLREEARMGDPDGQGVSFVLARDYVTAPEWQWPETKIRLALTNITLGEVLDTIVKVAGRPISYSIEDFGVVFSLSNPSSETLYMREFRVDPTRFAQWYKETQLDSAPPNEAIGIPRVIVSGAPPSAGLERTAAFSPASRTNSASETFHSLKAFFAQAGVDFQPPKAVFYKDRLGLLLVNATQQDLDKIERLVEMWNTTSPAAVPAAAAPSLDNSSVRPPSAPAENEPATSVELPANRFKSNSQSSFATNQFSASPAATETNATALVRSAKLLLEMGKLDEAEEELKAALRLDPENQPAFYYWSFVKETRYRQADRLREQRSKHAIQVEQNWSSSDIKNHLAVPNPFATNTLIWTGSGRRSILNKLNSIKLDSVFYDGLRLSEVVRNLNDETKKRDPLKKGLNFIINPNAQAAASPPGPTAIDPTTGLPVAAPPAEAVDVGSIPVKINPALIDMRLADVLDIIVKVADRPIKYSVEEWGIMFSLKGAEAQPLFMREFKWDRQSFEKWVRYAAGIPPSKAGDKTNLEGEEAQAMYGAMRGLFSINGVDLNAPKSVYYSHGAQVLLANASQSDLETIQRLMEIWATTSPPTVPAGASPASGETNATSDRAKATPSSVRKDKVPVLGDLPALGKLFRSESAPSTTAVANDSSPAKLNQAIPNSVGRQTNNFRTQIVANVPRTESQSPPLSAPSGLVSTGNHENAPSKKVEALFMREFRVDPDTLYKTLEAANSRPVPMTNVWEAVRDFFKRDSVDLSPPKTVFFNDRAGLLLVNATLQDLERIEKLLQRLNVAPARVRLQETNAAPTQISIKVRFVEVKAGDGHGGLFLGNLPTNSMAGSSSPANGATTTAAQPSGNGQFPSGASSSAAADAGTIGILTDPQFRAVLSALEQRQGVDLLSAPEVITVSGRQAQIQLADLKTIVSGVSAVVTNAQTNFVYKTQTIPFGSMVDVIPQVQLDGKTLSMTVIPTITEFLGYDDPDQIISKFPSEARSNARLPLPRTRIRQITSSVTVQDGQTLVLMNFPDQELIKNADGSETLKPYADKKRRQLIVFVTPTLIDPAGNLLHPPPPASR